MSGWEEGWDGAVGKGGDSGYLEDTQVLSKGAVITELLLIVGGKQPQFHPIEIYIKCMRAKSLH